MSKHRYNVGILITAHDADIAAYLNFLLSNKQTPAMWLSAMVVAYEMGKPFSIPDFRSAEFPKDPSPSPAVPGPLGAAPLIFGTGSTIQQKPKDKWGYGWQVRGNNGEFVQGSVVNISFCRPEVIHILQGMRQKDFKIASFLKELMRQNMSLSDSYRTEVDAKELLRVFYLTNSSHSSANASSLSASSEEVFVDMPMDDTIASELPRTSSVSPHSGTVASPPDEDDNPLLAYI